MTVLRYFLIHRRNPLQWFHPCSRNDKPQKALFIEK